MSDFMGVSKNLMREKWMQMNWIIVIDLIFLLAIDIIHIFTNGFDQQASFLYVSYSVSMVFAMMVGFILLARKNEQTFTSNNYRLLPITDTKLYFSNLLTTFLAFIYLQVVGVVISLILYGFEGGHPDTFGETSGNIGNAVLSVTVLAILSLILLLTGITLVHLLIDFIGGFLPFGRQKFVMFVLYLIVIFVGLNIFNATTGNIFRILYNNGQIVFDNLNRFAKTVWLSDGIFLAWSAIFSALNIYLLKRWTETVR